MRLLLMGAFAYPHHQGSQVYFQEQAIALRAAGAEVDLLTYGPSTSGDPPRDDARWRALDGFRHWRSPGWSTPNSARSGPNWRKPIADLALAKTFHDAIASNLTQESIYDAILTHNAEAALVADGASGPRQKRQAPLIYCAHTLMGQELSSYAQIPNFKRIFGKENKVEESQRVRHSGLRRSLDRGGSQLDRMLARRSDGWIALTQSSQRVMRKASTAPGARIPPPLPDPRLDPGRLDPVAIARKYGLEPKSFCLYTGNLDGYQDLSLLREVAVAAHGPNGSDLPTLVVASHDAQVLSASSDLGPGLTPCHVASAQEMRALIAAAGATLVTRRSEGGFPIKLANSLAAGTVPITLQEREWGLTDQENAWVVRDAEPVQAFAAAIQRLARDPGLADRLGARARALYEANHAPEAAAEQTLDLIERVIRGAQTRRRS